MKSKTERQLQRAARRKRKWMRRTRVLRQLRTYPRYFWLPCPLCGEHFGGNEWEARITIPSEVLSDRAEIFTGICPACELDLGAKAAAMCARDGHQRIESFGGGSIPFVSDDEGHYIATVTLDLSTPTSAYCATCGIDLPAASQEPTQ